MEARGTVTGEQGAVQPPLHARTPVFGHLALGGHQRTKLEANGRLVIPSSLRGPYVALGACHLLVVDTVVWLWTRRAFELNADALVAENRDLSAENLKKTIFEAAFEVSVDKQARIVLPPNLRHDVALDGEIEVVVSGSVDHLEIWSAEQWERDHAPAVSQVGLLFKGRAPLPTGEA